MNLERVEWPSPWPVEVNQIRRSCWIKVAYKTRQEGQKAAGLLNHNRGPGHPDRVKAYWCAYCGQYHVGRKKAKR